MVAAYRKIIKTTMFLTFALMFALGAVSEPLLYCLIGPKWHEVATYLPMICLIGSLYPLHAINRNMLQVQGRSDLFLGLEIAKKIIGLAPLFIGVFVGIFPMLYTIVITSIISYFLNSYFSGKLLGYSSWMQLRDIAPLIFHLPYHGNCCILLEVPPNKQMVYPSNSDSCRLNSLYPSVQSE